MTSFAAAWTDRALAVCAADSPASFQTIAKHVMNIHMNRATDASAVGEIDIETMKRYISYCKA